MLKNLFNLTQKWHYMSQSWDLINTNRPLYQLDFYEWTSNSVVIKKGKTPDNEQFDDDHFRQTNKFIILSSGRVIVVLQRSVFFLVRSLKNKEIMDFFRKRFKLCTNCFWHFEEKRKLHTLQLIRYFPNPFFLIFFLFVNYFLLISSFISKVQT